MMLGMPRTWEYAVVSIRADPGSTDGASHGWLRLPGTDQWEDLGKLSGWDFIDRLGSEGWELIGPPSSQKAVFTYKAANGTWHDRSYSVESTYLFKREAG
jgi:hypothetical protein